MVSWKTGDRHIRIDGLKLIADYMEITVTQVKRWSAITVPIEERLPVFTLTAGTGKRARLSAFCDELDAWMRRRADSSLLREE